MGSPTPQCARPVVAVGAVLPSGTPARRSDEDITVFNSSSFAIHDLYVAYELLARRIATQEVEDSRYVRNRSLHGVFVEIVVREVSGRA